MPAATESSRGSETETEADLLLSHTHARAKRVSESECACVRVCVRVCACVRLTCCSSVGVKSKALPLRVTSLSQRSLSFSVSSPAMASPTVLIRSPLLSTARHSDSASASCALPVQCVGSVSVCVPAAPAAHCRPVQRETVACGRSTSRRWGCSARAAPASPSSGASGRARGVCRRDSRHEASALAECVHPCHRGRHAVDCSHRKAWPGGRRPRRRGGVDWIDVDGSARRDRCDAALAMEHAMPVSARSLA